MQGHIDRLRAGILDGWVWDPAHPGDRLCIEISDEFGEILALGIADNYRSDLLDAAIGDGAHAFSIRLPKSMISARALHVRVCGQDYELAGSPIQPTMNSPDDWRGTTLLAKEVVDSMKMSNESLPEQFISLTKQLAQRRLAIAKHLLEFNAEYPGLINTLGAPAAQHERPPLRDVLIFPPIDWDYRYQRPQHFACELARLGHRVFYISPHFLLTTSSIPGNIYDIPREGVFLLRLKCGAPHPEINRATFTEAQTAELLRSLEGLIKDIGITSPIMLIQNPVWYSVAKRIHHGKITYDCLDLISGFEATSESMLVAEHDLIRDAELVIASSNQLIDYVTAHAPRHAPLLIRNATSQHLFTLPGPKANCPTPVIGYLGAIERWFDWRLIKDIAERKPEWTFVIAGHPIPEIKEGLTDIVNVHLLGEIPATEIAVLLSTFDVGLIPFISDEMSKHVNPVKVYEYLAAGLGVVACKMPELEQFGELVIQASGADEFSTAIIQHLNENSNQKNRERKIRVLNETWPMRALTLSQFISI